MTLGIRRLTAAVIAAGAAWLLVVNVPAMAAALRSRRAFVSACDSIPATAPTGAWVRLEGCGTSLFYNGFLTDAAGRRTRRLIPLWWIDFEARKAIRPSHVVQTIPLMPSRIALALPISAITEETGFRLDNYGGLYPDGLTPVVKTMGVIIARTGTPSHRVTDVPGAESGLAGRRAAIVRDQVGACLRHRAGRRCRALARHRMVFRSAARAARDRRRARRSTRRHR